MTKPKPEVEVEAPFTQSTHWMLDGEEVGVFDVPGPPVSKERPRKGKGGHFYTPKRTKEYEAGVAWCAAASGLKLEPKVRYQVEIQLHLSSMNRDVDNMGKCILDGMGQLPNWNDVQVRTLLVREVTVTNYPEEMAIIRVTKESAWK